jgi:adenine/guanine phosphoribosyltransferase-like PRPP-binding protein
MITKEHCEQLMKFKNEGVRFSSYMGIRWFVAKGILVILALIMLLNEEQVVRIVGFIVSGYLLGVIAANIRSYVVVKKNWEIQSELIDWHKVEEHFGEERGRK